MLLKMELYLKLGLDIKGEEGDCSRQEEQKSPLILHHLCAIWPHSSLRMGKICSQFC